MKDVDLVVKELAFSSAKPSAAEIENAFNAKEIEYSSIACVNWEGYNGDYNPDVKFRIGYTEEEIYIQYLVTENDIKDWSGVAKTKTSGFDNLSQKATSFKVKKNT